MHPRLRQSAALFSVVAVLGGGGIAATQATGATGTAASATAAMPPRGGLTTTQLERIAAKLGVPAAQLKAAVEANRPARRDDAERPPSGAGPAADLAKALGVDAAKVQNVLEANRPAAGTRDARPAKPDHTKLVAALAAGLNLDKAKVKAALDKVHTAREAARGPARG